MLTSILAILGGIVLLVWGAESLVSGAAWIAERLGVPPLVIGLTLVAYGTSFPEFLVSLTAGLRGAEDLALGNVVGSNICNIGLVLGFSALLQALPVDLQLLRREMPLVIGLGVVLPLLVLNDYISRVEGICLAVAGIIFTFTTVWRELKAPPEEQDHVHPGEVVLFPGRDWLWTIVRIAVGSTALLFGSRFLVDGAIEISTRLGISEAVIGISVVAVGTSLPELATSVIAALKKEADISIGNVLGSNIFNVLFVLGWATTIHPFDLAVDTGLWIDMGVALLFALALLPLMKTGAVLSRREGIVLFSGYWVYVGYLALWRF